MNHNLPNKEEYFRTLHRKLAQRYLLGSDLVFYVREQYFSQNKTKEQIIQDLTDSINRKDNQIKVFKVEELEQNKQLKYDFNQTLLNYHAQKHLINWLQQCTTEEWADITQATPFDLQVHSQTANTLITDELLSPDEWEAEFVSKKEEVNGSKKIT